MAKVKKSTLQMFIDKGGYSLVSFEDGAWRGKAEAARVTGLGVMTIGRILEENPTEPHKGQAAYVAEFEKSQGYILFKQKYGNVKNFDEKARQIREAWKINDAGAGLLNKKDPISWTHDDYAAIWSNPKFFKKEFKGKDFNGVPEGYASTFHNLMRVTKKHDLLNAFQGKKFPKGSKLEWYLEDDDIIGLSENYTDNECLISTILGINVGARWSSSNIVKPEDFNKTQKVVMMYEPKRKEYVARRVRPAIIDLVFRYIKDYKIQPSEPLFTQEYDFYLRKMKEAGKRSEIAKNVTTHILKHTFVTQAHRHGVSAEIIVEQTGTDWTTLSKHYRAGDEKKARHELQGETYDVEPFPVWIDRLIPFYEKAYERIKVSGIVDGVRAKIE